MDKIFEALSNNGFATADYLVFAVYIVILVGMGLFLSRTKKGEEKSSTDYFLAGNTLTWWPRREKRNRQPTTSWQVTP